MAKIYSVIGFGGTVETRPGVREDVIRERKFFGDVLYPSRQFRESDKVNADAYTGTQLSFVIDDWAAENIFAIRFVEWHGEMWFVKSLSVERPRLILRLGDVYNGPRATNTGINAP